MENIQGCPGSRIMDFAAEVKPPDEGAVGEIKSQLRQWPLQMHLVNPGAPYYQGADVLLAADCVAYAHGDFHRTFLEGKSLAIACPKLDDGQDVYQQKIKSLIDEAKINTLSVLIMEVPCCMGLLSLAKQAADTAERKVPIKATVIGVKGDVLREQWV